MVVRRSCIVSPREPIVDTKVSTSHPDSSKEIIAPILVGVDTRGRSTSAVVWAAEEADRAGRPLRLVTVNEGPDGSEDPQAAHGLVTLARRLTLAEVQHVALAGSPADVLLEEAARASLVVVGRRGLVPAKRLLVGGTSLVVSAPPAAERSRVEQGRPSARPAARLLTRYRPAVPARARPGPARRRRPAGR
jgi:nucleotide-binding universal stress UspA family protein